MLRDRFQIVLLLTFLVFSLALAAENATEEEPPLCSKPSQTQTSSSDSEDDDDDDEGEGLPIEEEPPCVPPLEFEPTEETEQTNETESTDEAEPTQLSLDESNEHSDNETAHAGT